MNWKMKSPDFPTKVGTASASVGSKKPRVNLGRRALGPRFRQLQAKAANIVRSERIRASTSRCSNANPKMIADHTIKAHATAILLPTLVSPYRLKRLKYLVR